MTATGSVPLAVAAANGAASDTLAEAGARMLLLACHLTTTSLGGE